MFIIEAKKFCEYAIQELVKDMPNVKAALYTADLDLLEVFVLTQCSTLSYVLQVKNVTDKFNDQKELIDELKWQYKCRVTETKKEGSLAKKYCLAIEDALRKRVNGTVDVSPVGVSPKEDDLFVTIIAHTEWTGRIKDFAKKVIKENYSVQHFVEDALRDYEADLKRIYFKEERND